MTKDEALNHALQLVSNLRTHSWTVADTQFVITAIKEALAQPEQEPVAFEEWLSNQHGDPEEIGFLQALRIAYISGQDSITTPPQRKPLTDEEIIGWVESGEYNVITNDWASHINFARAIEAAHGIKGEA